MKRTWLILLLFTCCTAMAQPKRYFSAAWTDQCTTYPFARAIGLVKEPLHPGFELAWGKDLKIKAKHDWYREILAGYFYHRFLQHGIPLYIRYGYRYKFSKKLSADASLGAGYFHSISAVDLLKRDANGNYHAAKGIGRPQGMAAFTMGVGYGFHLMKDRTAKVFLQYQARLQAPFVKSYVPMLPYTQIALGLSTSFQPRKK